VVGSSTLGVLGIVKFWPSTYFPVFQYGDSRGNFSLVQECLSPCRNPSTDTGFFLCRSSVTKRILIADDHESMLRGLRVLLGANPARKICGDAPVDGKEAGRKGHRAAP